VEELGSIPFIRDVAKKTDSTKYAMPAFRFKTCRLLPGNVRNRELSLIQRRILRRLRNKRRSIKRNLSQRENLNSNIKSQTTRKLSIYYGDLPIREMHRGRERTSYIPFLLNQCNIPNFNKKKARRIPESKISNQQKLFKLHIVPFIGLVHLSDMT
jgi:hypothetical protein